MIGNRRLSHSQLVHQNASTFLTVPKKRKNCKPFWVAQSLKDLSVFLMDVIHCINLTSKIFDMSSICNNAFFVNTNFQKNIRTPLTGTTPTIEKETNIINCKRLYTEMERKTLVPSK